MRSAKSPRAASPAIERAHQIGIKTEGAAEPISSLQLQSIADYVAMVSLAQLDPTGHTTGVPSILNPFSERDAGRARRRR